MDLLPTDPDAPIYTVDNLIHKKFLDNSNFCLCLQEYLKNSLSIEIAIIPQEPPRDWPKKKKQSLNYLIQLLGTYENREEMERIVSDFFKDLFTKIQCQTFSDDKVKKWLQHSFTRANNIKCIEEIINETSLNLFVVCEEDAQHSLRIHYVAKDLMNVPDSEELNKIIELKISQEVVEVLCSQEQSKTIMKESKTMIAKAEKKGNVSVFIDSIYSGSRRKSYNIILFGYHKLVNRLKNEFLNMIDRRSVVIFKLNLLDEFQIEFLLRECAEKLKQIVKTYKEFGVHFRLRRREFVAPQHLKDEIESCITQLLSSSTSKTFKSIPLSKDIADIAEKQLKNIARKCHCHIITESKYKFRSYTIPKGLSSNGHVLKSTMEQSEHFLSSPDVFNRLAVADGSIEIRTGDIARQDVDTIVIPVTFNGLREGVIERADAFNYEKNYTDETNIKFTETNGGKLNCKRILFSNWTPSKTMNDDDLRKSIKIFISKSIEHATKEKTQTSVAFAVPDSCSNEIILAREMIDTAKKQLESKNLQLKISFILLPEQRTLHSQCFAVIGTMQDIYAQFDWTNRVIKTTVIASHVGNLTKCQEKINSYLNQCTTSKKLTNSNSIFQHWDQYTINAFYKYCQDQCVLLQIDQKKQELELIGPVNNVIEASQRWSLLSDLMAEKFSRISSIECSSSVAMRTPRARSEAVIEAAKVYNIMISYCQEDIKQCQYLINRLTEEGFFVWAEPLIVEQPRDVSSQISKADCIILCVSENYCDSSSCEKEARYAFQTSKQVFPVKIQNHSLISWQREVFEERIFFQLFGSKNHFDLQFGKLLFEILRYTKPTYGSLLQQISGGQNKNADESRSFLTVEQRRSMHNHKIRTLTDIGRIGKKEMKTLVEQLQNVINDIDNTGSESNDQAESNNDNHIRYQNATDILSWIKRWLKKPTNMTKQNLPPFSASGDINDAIFPMPEYILLQHRDLHTKSLSFMPSTSVNLRNIFEYDIIKRPIERTLKRVSLKTIPIDEDRIYRICSPKVEYFNGLSQIFSAERTTPDNDSQKRATLPLVSSKSFPWKKTTMHQHPASNDSKQMAQERINIIQHSSKKYACLSRKQLEPYFQKFAERMRQNATQFEHFCLTNATVVRQRNQKDW
ncbi:unnamed protein product [Rotaria socialis]|uniref:TIR domain-containing protein n=1 Tax=Rotaria socialis TaxID=392032 RepID=A0A820H4S6_9BILA|nr:unnamed protein product [Rotaria socialis]